MDKIKINLFGSSGMMGYAALRYLSKNPNFEIKLYGRDAEKLSILAYQNGIKDYFFYYRLP